MSLKTRAHCFVVRPQSPHLALQSCSEHSFHVVLCHSQNSCLSTQAHLTLHPSNKNTYPHHITILCAVHCNTRVLTGIRFLPPPLQPREIFPSNPPPRRGPQFPNSRSSRHHRRFPRLRRRFNGGIEFLQLGHCLLQVPPLHAPLHRVRSISHFKQKFREGPRSHAVHGEEFRRNREGQRSY